MHLKKFTSLLFFLASFSLSGRAQIVAPNIDFELGDLSVWSFYIGTCCVGGLPETTTPTAPIACRHSLTSSLGIPGCTGVTPAILDQYGLFPIVPPGGGNHALRLGGPVTGGLTERATYFVHVPTGPVNYSLIYQYAVVLQFPPHPIEQQPRFIISAYDSATMTPLPCGQHNYRLYGPSVIPGFQASTIDANVYYKPWAASSIDLSAYSGMTVGIDVISSDCDPGGHFGYGYFDMSPGLFQVSVAACDTTSPITLIAPAGFATYSWYDSATFTHFYGTGDTMIIPPVSAPTTIAVIMVPYDGFGCSDTLYTTVISSHMAFNITDADTAVCLGQSVVLNPNVTDILSTPLTYSWSPATGLSCTTCATPTASPTTTTAYTVTVTNSAGCEKDTVFTVAVRPDVNTTITVDTPTCHGYTNGSATCTPTSGTGPYTYTWTTSPVQTTGTATGLGTGTYTVFVTDMWGCRDTNTAYLLNPAPRTVSVVTSSNPTTCLGMDGSITITGTVAPSTNYTISYKLNGIPQTMVVTSDGALQMVLSALGAGTYTDITIIGALCPYSLAGPVVLTDPANPDLSGVTSNSYVCVGDTLKLFASSTTTGVAWHWEGPAGFSSFAQNPMIIPVTMANAGTYSVTVSKNNCYNYSSTVVDVRVLPVPAASSNTPVCSGDTLYLHSSSSNGATSYSWTGPNFFSSVDKDPYIAHVQTVSTGVYTVNVTLNGCTVPYPLLVTINQTPDAPIGPDTNYCQFDVSIPFSASGVNLLWFTTATGGTGTPTAPTPSTAKGGTETWYVNQTSAEGCVSERTKITAKIWKMPYPTLSATDRVSCVGKYMTFTVGETGEGATGLTWYFEPNDSIQNVNPIHHAFNSVGSFMVTANAYYRYCRDTILNVPVDIFPFPSFNLGPDTSICAGSMAIELAPKSVYTYGGNVSWTWSTGETTQRIKIVAPGTYVAKAAMHGCETTDSIFVDNDCYIDIPNVFTPNGDGINDYFFPRQLLSKGLTAFDMSIYNRWGQLIFKGNALDGRGWDGSFNGVPQPEGVFVYVIDAAFKDGQKEHHAGNVTLMR